MYVHAGTGIYRTCTYETDSLSNLFQYDPVTMHVHVWACSSLLKLLLKLRCRWTLGKEVPHCRHQCLPGPVSHPYDMGALQEAREVAGVKDSVVRIN